MNDGRPDPAKQRQFTNFGIMTFDRKPKLACWELWHLWRDFEVKPSEDALAARQSKSIIAAITGHAIAVFDD